MNDTNLDTTPGDLAYFTAAEYTVFDERHRFNLLYNERRTVIKNKLLRLHEIIYPEMQRRRWKIYPHWHKGWVVSAWYISPHMACIPFMRLRYAKSKALMRRMEKLFLDDFGHFHAHVMLAVTIDQDAIGIELSIPSAAWVDGQNLRGKLVGAPNAYEFRRQFGEIVSSLGFRAQVQIEEHTSEGHGRIWTKRARAFRSPAPLATASALYEPGKHVLRIGTWYRPDDPQLNAMTISQEVLAHFEQLYPLYELIAWAPTNDYRRYAVKKWPRAGSQQ